jgi:CheY-like chemotaxis protein
VTPIPRPTRVLIVDDHPDGADTLAQVLRFVGHEARVARTPEEAARIVGGFTPDAVLMDIGLPGLDGYRLADQLCRALGRRPLLVAMTGYPRLADQSRDEGFDHHFEKPVDLAALVAVLAGLTRPPAP